MRVVNRRGWKPHRADEQVKRVADLPEARARARPVSAKAGTEPAVGQEGPIPKAALHICIL